MLQRQLQIDTAVFPPKLFFGKKVYTYVNFSNSIQVGANPSHVTTNLATCPCEKLVKVSVASDGGGGGDRGEAQFGRKTDGERVL